MSFLAALDGYPYAYISEGQFQPKEANPIYTSIATSRSYSGSRTKLTTYPDTGARPIALTNTVTQSFSGSIPEWTWTRVYPSEFIYNYGAYGSDIFSPYPARPVDPHESYFSLAPSLHVRPPNPNNYSTDYFDPKKQALGFYSMGFSASSETVIIGTTTIVFAGLGVGNVPFSNTLTFDIIARKYPTGDGFPGTTMAWVPPSDTILPKVLTATQDYGSWSPRLPVLTWGYLQYDEGLADYVHYGVDVTAWSATKWRDYKGSYSAVIPMPSGGTAWDSSNVETTVNWTLG